MLGLDNQDLFIVQEYIKEFLASKERKLMLDGQLYYENEPLGIEMPHAFMTNLVDEKVQYLLGKEPSMTSSIDNSGYLDEVINVLSDNFLYDLQLLGTETSNKGIAWEQLYFDEEGTLKRMLIPSEQIKPVWVDNSHRELKWVIRIYDIEEYTNNKKEAVTKVEVYDSDKSYYYILDNGTLKLDSEKYLQLNDNEEFGHFTIDGKQYSFGRVPFVFCKNNTCEMPDLKMVKELIDAYCHNRERLDKLLEDFKNFLVVIRNYAENTENAVSLDEMLEKRRIWVDTDGGVELVNPTIDTTANESHDNTLKDDIILFGRSVDRNKMISGNTPSGVALKTLYSGLDLKCNKLEIELKNYFNQIMWFIKSYLEVKGVRPQDKEKLSIILNRDITMNESQVITDCKNSVGVISTKTIVANHPYVTDVDEELKQIEAENAFNMEYYAEKLGDNLGNE